jgi:hypothetical protein
MAEAADKKGKGAEGKAKGRGAEGKKNKYDPRMVKNIARVVSGLGPEEWSKLGKEGQKKHVKTAKKVLAVQKKIASKPAKEKSAKAGSAGDAESGQD